MKKLIVILSLQTLIVSAQNHLVGIKAGVNLSNIAPTNFLTQTGIRTGVSMGLTYDYMFKKYFSLAAEINYNQRGFTSDILITDNAANPTIKKRAAKLYYDYVALPLKAGFDFGNLFYSSADKSKRFYGFVNIGVIPSLLVNAKTTGPAINDNGQSSATITYDVADRVTKFDVAGLAEIEAGYILKNGFRLFTSFAYQHGFTTITNEEYFEDSKIQHRWGTMAIGLKFNLTGER